MEAVALNPTRLALAAIIGLIILLVLIIKFHVHAMISILVGALSIGLIAGEKAGILRKGCPAVYLTEPEEAYQVIRQKALQVGAPVFEVSPQMWKVNRADDNGIDFSVDNRYDKTLRITFKGKALFQCENAALAATACGIVLREAGKYDPEVLVRGIERFAIPGRMEQILNQSLARAYQSGRDPGFFGERGGHCPGACRAARRGTQISSVLLRKRQELFSRAAYDQPGGHFYGYSCGSYGGQESA